MWTAAAALFYLVETPLALILPAHLLGLVRAGYCLAVLVMIIQRSRDELGRAVTDSDGADRGGLSASAPTWLRGVAVRSQIGWAARSLRWAPSVAGFAPSRERSQGPRSEGPSPVYCEEPLWQPAWTSQR
jgi:hypothetical protein